MNHDHEHYHRGGEHGQPKEANYGRMLVIEGVVVDPVVTATSILDAYIKKNGWESLKGVGVVAVRAPWDFLQMHAQYIVLDYDLLVQLKHSEFLPPDKRLVTKKGAGMTGKFDQAFGEQGTILNATEAELWREYVDIMIEVLKLIKTENIIAATEEMIAQILTQVDAEGEIHIENLKKLLGRWTIKGLGGSVILSHLGDQEELANAQEALNNGMIALVMANIPWFINKPRKVIKDHLLANIDSPEFGELVTKIKKKLSNTKKDGRQSVEPTKAELSEALLHIIEVASMASTDTTKSAALKAVEMLSYAQKKLPDFFNKMLAEAQLVVNNPAILESARSRSKLTHIYAFVLEVLRVANVVQTSALKSTQDIALNNSQSIPKGKIVLPGYKYISENPEYWDGDTSFNPARWLPYISAGEVVTSDMLLNKGMRFVAFAVEDRDCPGMPDAIKALVIQISLLLAKVCSEFEIMDVQARRMPADNLVIASMTQESSLDWKRKPKSRQTAD